MLFSRLHRKFTKNHIWWQHCEQHNELWEHTLIGRSVVTGEILRGSVPVAYKRNQILFYIAL